MVVVVGDGNLLSSVRDDIKKWEPFSACNQLSWLPGKKLLSKIFRREEEEEEESGERMGRENFPLLLSEKTGKAEREENIWEVVMSGSGFFSSPFHNLGKF